MHLFETVLHIFLFVEECNHFVDLAERLFLIFDALLVLLLLDLFAEYKIYIVSPSVAFLLVLKVQLENSLLCDYK